MLTIVNFMFGIVWNWQKIASEAISGRIPLLMTYTMFYPRKPRDVKT